MDERCAIRRGFRGDGHPVSRLRYPFLPGSLATMPNSIPTDHGNLTRSWNLLNDAFGGGGSPNLGVRCLSARFSLPSGDAADARRRLEGAGATVFFSGEMPPHLRAGEVNPLISGVLSECSFSAVLENTAGGPVLFVQLQLPSTQMDGPDAAFIEAAFHVCDRLFGGDKASPQLISGYLAHRLGRLGKKPRGRLLAEIASLLADHLHDIAD
jgi:hypothetical protein